jgi:hypothetical protein
MAGVLLQDSLLVLMILGLGGEAASVASVRGLQAVLRDPVLAGQPGLQERGWRREEERLTNRRTRFNSTTRFAL